MSEGIIELEGEATKKDSEGEEADKDEEEAAERERRKLAKPKTRRQKRDKKKSMFERMKQDSQLKYKLKENDVFRIRYHAETIKITLNW